MSLAAKPHLAAAIIALLSASGAQALPAQSVFTAAGLGSAADWTLIPSPSVWGTGGNGFFPAGGTATFELRLADFLHTFDTIGVNNSFGYNVILHSFSTVGQPVSWTPVTNPFAFGFQNIGSKDADFITSDGVVQGVGLDIAIYRSLLNPNQFAFFFDDGGGKTDAGPDDNDFDDMVVTAIQGAVPEPASLALFGAALAALGLSRRRLKRPVLR